MINTVEYFQAYRSYQSYKSQLLELETKKLELENEIEEIEHDIEDLKERMKVYPQKIALLSIDDLERLIAIIRRADDPAPPPPFAPGVEDQLRAMLAQNAPQPAPHVAPQSAAVAPQMPRKKHKRRGKSRTLPQSPVE